MLRGIHKASSTWLGKGVMAVVMGIIAISFAIWGIGDIFRGFGRNAVATILRGRVLLRDGKLTSEKSDGKLVRPVRKPSTYKGGYR